MSTACRRSDAGTDFEAQRVGHDGRGQADIIKKKVLPDWSFRMFFEISDFQPSSVKT